MIQALQNVDFLSQIFEVLLRLAVLDDELERDDLPAVFAPALRCRRGGKNEHQWQAERRIHYARGVNFLLGNHTVACVRFGSRGRLEKRAQGMTWSSHVRKREILYLVDLAKATLANQFENMIVLHLFARKKSLGERNRVPKTRSGRRKVEMEWAGMTWGGRVQGDRRDRPKFKIRRSFSPFKKRSNLTSPFPLLIISWCCSRSCAKSSARKRKCEY